MRLHFDGSAAFQRLGRHSRAEDRQLEGADNHYQMTEKIGSRHFPRFRSKRMNHFRRPTSMMTWGFRASGRPEIGKDEDSLISPFDVIGEQLSWFAYCAEALLDLVPV